MSLFRKPGKQRKMPLFTNSCGEPEILNDLKSRSHNGFSHASEIALIYIGLDEKDQAMTWLEKAYVERFNPSVLLRPCFDPLRSNPRFQDLLRRIGLNR